MPPDSLPSSEIDSVLDSIRDGDKSALELLFVSHRAYLRQVISLRMHDALRVRIDPSDIVQETLVEATRQLANCSPNPKLPVRLWMRQIAVQRLAMAHRRHLGAGKRSLRRHVSLPDQSSIALAGMLVGNSASPSGNAMRIEVSDIVRDAVAQLPEIDREIILLQSYEGLNSTEAAIVLGIEPTTARKRYGRALLRLRRLLTASGLGDWVP